MDEDTGPPELPEDLSDAPADVQAAAWKQSGGSHKAYHMLVREHRDGEINLLSDEPAPNPVSEDECVAPGSDALTATGGETYGDHGPVVSVQGTVPDAEVMSVAEAEALDTEKGPA